jgi:hypothetical protein
MATHIRSSPVPLKSSMEDPMLSDFQKDKRNAFLTTRKHLKEGQACLKEAAIDIGLFQARVAHTVERYTSENEPLNPKELAAERERAMEEYKELYGIYVKVSLLCYHTLSMINFLKTPYIAPSEESLFIEKLPDFYAEFMKNEGNNLEYAEKLKKLFSETVKAKSRYHELINGPDLLLDLNSLKGVLQPQHASPSLTDRFMKRFATPVIHEPSAEKPRIPLSGIVTTSPSSAIKALSPAFAKQVLSASQGISLSDDTSNSPRVSLSYSPRSLSPNIPNRPSLHPSDALPHSQLSASRHSTPRLIVSDSPLKTNYSPVPRKRAALSLIASDPPSTKTTPRTARNSPRLYPLDHSSRTLSVSSDSTTSSRRNPMFPSRSTPAARGAVSSWESIPLDTSSASYRSPRRSPYGSDHSTSRVSPRPNPLLERPSYSTRSRVPTDSSSAYRSARERREGVGTDPMLRRADAKRHETTTTDRVARRSSHTRSTPAPKVEAPYTKQREPLPERKAKRLSLTEYLREKIIGKMEPIAEKTPPSRGRDSRRTYEQDEPSTHGKSSRY